MRLSLTGVLCAAILPLLTAACTPPDASSAGASSSAAPMAATSAPQPVADGTVLIDKCRRQAGMAAAQFEGRMLGGPQLSSTGNSWTADRTTGVVSIRYVDRGQRLRSGTYVCGFAGEALKDFHDRPDERR